MKNPIPYFKLLLCIFIYFLALGLALNQYYRAYWLIGYMQVLIITACIFGVLLAAGFVLLYREKLLYRRHNSISHFFSLLAFSGMVAFVAGGLFLGIVPFVNAHIGNQQTVVLDVVLKQKERPATSANPAFYYTFYDDKDSSEYVLMSPYNIDFKPSVHLRLQKGCLGILYAK